VSTSLPSGCARAPSSVALVWVALSASTWIEPGPLTDRSTRSPFICAIVTLAEPATLAETRLGVVSAMVTGSVVVGAEPKPEAEPEREACDVRGRITRVVPSTCVSTSLIAVESPDTLPPGEPLETVTR
jgi:hypothetical protein